VADPFNVLNDRCWLHLRQCNEWAVLAVC